VKDWITGTLPRTSEARSASASAFRSPALVERPADHDFDEATSALDAATESNCRRRWRRRPRAAPTFVIAHRLATIRGRQQDFRLRSRKIVESGSFDALVAQNGKFAALARAQFMAAEAKS